MEEKDLTRRFESNWSDEKLLNYDVYDSWNMEKKSFAYNEFAHKSRGTNPIRQNKIEILNSNLIWNVILL